MKKNILNTVFIILIITVLTGCEYIAISKKEQSFSSSMIRTVGLGENAMPIEDNSLAIELFNDQAVSIDEINEKYIIYFGGNDNEDEYYLNGKRTDGSHRYFGLNLKYGIDDFTEIKVGTSVISMKNGYEKNYSTQDKKTFHTYVWGQQLGFKRLLTDYNSWHRVSFYGEGKYSTSFSEDIVAKYDGDILELKASLIYGYLKNPTKRNFPSFALYYSNTYTNRDNTIPGVSLTNQIQAIGLETNYSLDARPVYLIFFAGAEKEISANPVKGVNAYFGVRFGVNVNRKNEINIEED